MQQTKSFANETRANKIFNDTAPNSKSMVRLFGHVVENFEGSPNHPVYICTTFAINTLCACLANVCVALLAVYTCMPRWISSTASSEINSRRQGRDPHSS